MEKISKKQLKKYGDLLGKIISALSIAFVVYAIWKMGFDFEAIENWPVFLVISGISVILKALTVYVSGSAWTSWLRFFSGHKINYKEGLSVYAKANIGKYLPGNVMHYVERNLFAKDLGISQKKLAASSILEVGGLVGVAFVLALFFSANQLKIAFYEIFGADYHKVIIGAVIIIVLAVCVVILLLRKKLVTIMKDYKSADFIRTLLLAMLRYAVVLIVLGLIMVVLYVYMGGDVTLTSGMSIVSGYIIAWVLGFVIPGASGGIGVRELVITVLLGSVMGTELVLTLSVIHRLITILGDFLAYVLRLIIWRTKK